jgi:hypothetical protein
MNSDAFNCALARASSPLATPSDRARIWHATTSASLPALAASQPA